MRLVERLVAIVNIIRDRPQWSRVHVPRRQGGVLVTEDTAGTYSVVAACDRIISETMAALPWQVFRKAESGREALPKNPVQWLLNFQANPEQTAYIFRRTLVSNYLMWGKGLAEIERGLDGRPVWMWWLRPDGSRLERSPDTGELRVRTILNGQQYVLPRSNVFCLMDGSFDGLNGVSRIERARRAIGAGLAGDVMAAELFANGGAVGGIITQKTGKALSPDARDELLRSFNEKYGGPNNAAKTLYLDGGMDYARAGTMSMTDAQFLENRRFGIQEVARWFGVPLHLLMDLTESNYAVSYEGSKNFVEHTLRPIASLCEQEANTTLFGARSQNQIYSRMNLSGLMRGDPKKVRGQYYRWIIDGGIMSINEVRELEELNSIGPTGDRHYLQLNMTTIDHIEAGDNLAAAGAAPDSSAAADPDAAADDSEGPPDQANNVIRRQALAWWREQQKEQASA